MNLDSYVDRFIDEIREAESPKYAIHALSEFGSHFGFGGAAFLLMPRARNADGNLPIPLACLGEVPIMDQQTYDAWHSYYTSQSSFFDQDPIYLVCEHTALPFGWAYDESSIRVIGADAQFTATHIVRARMHIDVAKIRAGITAPIRLPFGHFGFVSLITDDPARVEGCHADALKSRLLIVAYLFHDAVKKLIVPTGNLEIPLRPRELDCLHLAAIGKSIQDTADLLGLSFSTVRFHLRNAERKLGVVTRSSAIASAVSLGLIHLH